MKITAVQIRKVLKEALFSVKTDRQMGVISDVGDREYYIKRAIEVLTRVDKNYFADIDGSIIMAIRLLVLAKINSDE